MQITCQNFYLDSIDVLSRKKLIIEILILLIFAKYVKLKNFCIFQRISEFVAEMDSCNYAAEADMINIWNGALPDLIIKQLFLGLKARKTIKNYQGHSGEPNNYSH